MVLSQSPMEEGTNLSHLKAFWCLVCEQLHGLTAVSLTSVTLFICLILGCFQVPRSTFVLPLCDIFIVDQIWMLTSPPCTAHQKPSGYRQDSDTLLSKSPGWLSNQNPRGIADFPSEEDLMQMPRGKSIQITWKEMFKECILNFHTNKVSASPSWKLIHQILRHLCLYMAVVEN